MSAKDKFKGDGSINIPGCPPPTVEITPIAKKSIEGSSKPSGSPAQLEIRPVKVNARLVKSEVANLEGRKLLQQSITMLYGVSDKVAGLLTQLKITSIFDLAMSHYFNSALRLVDPTSPLEAAFVQHGFIPGDTVHGDPSQLKISVLANDDIDELNFGNLSIAVALKDELQIKTIRDMALWPPFQNARQILLSTFDPTELTRRGEDPEAPADLIPASGNFPTECVYYTSVFLDKIDDSEKKLIDLKKSGGISLFSEKGNIQGFDQPAKGGILTYKQSWYAQGVTLGQLLHSLALAPGESTRIAMVDWYRRTGEKTSEDIGESDVLSQTTQQSRSISEITRAVATEMQHGNSQNSVNSKSGQFGISGGMGLIFQASAGGSTNNSIATSVSSSSGQRDMAAEMNQRILSSTQQNATAERSRRATIVRECYQEEKETLTTRAVTNYNHMHALTVQYYEVVQVYRAKTELWKAEQVLFIPMEPIAFRDPRVFRRYKEILKVVAVNEEIRKKLDSWSGYFDAMLTFAGTSGSSIYLNNSPALKGIEFDPRINIEEVQIFKGEDDKSETYDIKDHELQLDISLNVLSEIRIKFNNKPSEQDSDTPALPDAGPYAITYKIADNMIVDSFYPGILSSDKNEFVALRVKVNAKDLDLIQHLEETPLYSHAIWLSLDPLTLSQMFAGYKYGDEAKPLASQIDPIPVAIMGNYLGFRWNSGNEQVESDWQKKVFENRKPVEAEIPLPSGGVFAEAVLGRFNSAEKLDITRYWNWQDSPIPFTASDIAALSAGGKSEASTLTPGQLSQPAVTINAAQALPEPTGMQSIMQAMTASNMFRDMSNQAATVALAGQGLQTAEKGASNAVQQSSETLRTYIKTVGDVAKEVIPLVATGGLSGASMSKSGAAANLASKIDEKKGTSADGNGTGNQEAVLKSITGGVSKPAEKTETEEKEEAEEEPELAPAK